MDRLVSPSLLGTRRLLILIAMLTSMIGLGCSKKKTTTLKSNEPEQTVKKTTEVDPRFKPRTTQLVDEPDDPKPSAEERSEYQKTVVALACARIMNRDQPLDDVARKKVIAENYKQNRTFEKISEDLKGDEALKLAITNEIEKCPKPQVVVKKKRSRKKRYSHLKEMSRKDIMPIIRRHSGRVKSCFTRVFKNIQSSGKVRVRFTINTNGKPVGMGISAPGIPVGNAKRCVRSVLSGLKFPSGFRPKTVAIPISLKVKM